jgi:thiamine biosynthesis lipoprotein
MYKWPSVLTLTVAGVVLGLPTRRLDREVLSMGTRLDLHLEGASPARLQDASNRVLQDLDRIEGACSTWRPDTPWSQLNAARGAAFPLDREWIDLLASIQDWNRRTGGAFDPVLMTLIQAWGTRHGGRTPGSDELARARKAAGSSLLVLDRERGTARLLDPEAGVEEGGFLKGYALDRGVKVLRAEGVPRGWMDFGGQVIAFGEGRDVEVADADDRSRPRLNVRLPEGHSLSSSGCSQHGRHILDPRTGEPCPDWGAVAVIAPSGLDADVLSTALYVMGPERGPEWARAHKVAAVFLPHGGRVLQTPVFAALGPVLEDR